MRIFACREHRPLSGSELAAGLLKYSERGDDYVQEIRAVIRINNLAETDKAYRRNNTPAKLEPAGPATQSL